MKSEIPVVFLTTCEVCGCGSMASICTTFCYEVKMKWKAGQYGKVTLREAYRLASVRYAEKHPLDIIGEATIEDVTLGKRKP